MKVLCAVLHTPVIAMLFCAASFARAQPTHAATPPASAATVRGVLERQVAAWNRGDLEGFMATYWASPELTFFSGAAMTQGWQATLERYRRRYQTEGHSMGKLEFSELRVEMLGDRAAFVRGRWRLHQPDGKQPNGVFTVVLRRFNTGWKIIHDHTSAAD